MITTLRTTIFVGTIILVSFSMLFSSEKDLFKALEVEYLTVYTDYNPTNLDATLSGNGYSFICNINDYKHLPDVQGATFEVNNTPEYIFKQIKLEVQSSQKIEMEGRTIQIYYCYLKGLDKSVVVENKKVNLQIASDGESCILGIPLILGSY